MAKLKVVHKWVGLGQVQSFMLIVGLVGSRKLDPRPTMAASCDWYVSFLAALFCIL